MSSLISIDVMSKILLNVAVAFAMALVVESAHLVLKFRSKKHRPTYSERVRKLAENLALSSKEVDDILREIAAVTFERQEAAAKIEQELERLVASEAEIKQRIDLLKDVPIPVAEHFASLLDSGEKRSARRDYLLFGAGVLTSIISAIVLKWLGVA